MLIYGAMREWEGNCSECSVEQNKANKSERVAVLDIGGMKIRFCEEHMKELGKLATFSAEQG